MAKRKLIFSKFEASDYLRNDKVMAEYLSLAAQDENPAMLLKAIADVAKAKGMAKVARDSGLGRESLYKSLANGAKPRFETVAQILRALNVRLTIAEAR
jgi:probable addiction module antidote protein